VVWNDRPARRVPRVVARDEGCSPPAFGSASGPAPVRSITSLAEVFEVKADGEQAPFEHRVVQGACGFVEELADVADISWSADDQPQRLLREDRPYDAD
jgi:hypothetical protein